MKDLVIGKDYMEIFSQAAYDKGMTMIYNGGISWTGTKPDGSKMTKDSQETTDNAMAYVNQPSHSMRG